MIFVIDRQQSGWWKNRGKDYHEDFLKDLSSHQKSADSYSTANHRPAWHETAYHQLCWSNLWADRGKVCGYLSMLSENFCKDTFNVTI